MSFFQSEDHIIDILKQCFSKANKFQIVENSLNEAQPHYCSNIVSLTFQYEEDGIQNTKSLIFKVPVQGDLGLLADELNFFNRENFVYDTIIPRINNYLDEPLTPSYIKTADSTIIILDNLTAQGYETEKDNRQLYSQTQSYPIIKALAHFHAASHKVCQNEPHLLQNKMFHNPVVIETIQKSINFWEPILIELLARNNASYLIPKLRNAFQFLKNDDFDITSKLHYSNFQFFVLNHSDFRKDNIMLKYSSRDTVEDVKIIDFQTCFWSTPTLDFMYFLLLSADVELIENHFETLVSLYLQCLNEKLQKINCTQTYNRQDFDADIKNLSFCFILLLPWAIFPLCPLDDLERTKLLDESLQGKTENIRHYTEILVEDDICRRKVLSVCKLWENLGLFEA